MVETVESFVNEKGETVERKIIKAVSIEKAE